MMTRASTSFFDAYPPGPRDVVFLGDSITAAGQWNEIFPNYSVRNRGIGGDRTDDLLKRLHQVTASPVDKLFIKIGTNDLGTGVGQETILANYATLLDRLSAEMPTTSVYVQSLLPREAEYRDRVERLNSALSQLSASHGVTYIDLYPAFLADDGSIVDDLAYDELHLTGAGYRLWQEQLAPYIQQ